MNFESLEQLRYETTRSVMEAMAKIAADESKSMPDRLKAAQIVDAMSDSLIKAYLMTEGLNKSDGTNKKMLQQLDKLTDKRNHDED